MKTDKKYLITTEVPCAYCNGEGNVWCCENGAIFLKYKQTCQSCQGSGKGYKQVPLEEALQDLGYVPNEEKPSEPLSVAYRGLKIIKEDNRYWTVDTLKKEEYVGCYFHFETWQKALEFVDAELRKGIPEPQI